MTDSLKPSFHKSLSRRDDVSRVLAYVTDSDGANFHRIVFEKTSVDYVMEVRSGLSAIALKSGVKIPVAMDFIELEKRIYESDDPVLDLRAQTGKSLRESVPELSREMEKNEGLKTTFEDKPMAIAVFVRQAHEQNFKMFAFSDDDVSWGGISGESGRNGDCTHLPLLHKRGPFGEKEIIIDLPRPAFMELYNKAKMNGVTELDLRDLTRRRDPDETLKKKGIIPKF